MESNVNYTVVGLFILLLGSALIAGGFWLSSEKTIKLYDTYLIYLNDSVAGLSLRSPVKYNGVDVGYVSSIELNQKNPQEVKMLVVIERHVPITRDTVATVMSFGVTGMGYIGLHGGAPNSPLLKETDGEDYPVIKSEPSLMKQLDTVLREVSTNIGSVTKNIDALVNAKNQQAFERFLNNIDRLSATLARNSDAIDSSITDASLVLESMAKVSDQIPEIITKLNQASSEIVAMSKKLNNTGEEVTGTMRDAKVAIRSISQQTAPSMQKALENINAVAMQIQQLTTQLNADPSLLIKGKEPAPLGPGE